MTSNNKNYEQYLPIDKFEGTLIGRVWLPKMLSNNFRGPSPVIIKGNGIYDLNSIKPTVSQLLHISNLNEILTGTNHKRIGDYNEIMANTIAEKKDENIPYFISPIDLHAIKACGVTFFVSMLERFIEERAGGDSLKAREIREKLNSHGDIDLAKVVPGSKESETLKKALQEEGMWSQYFEVGIGPFAEIFTKAQPLSSVGIGAEIGILEISSWNNPEPETVLVVNSNSEVIGATLGNDVNLRDIEGRSALLLGKAKDNNASCSIGPFIRIFDENFSIDDIRTQEVRLNIKGNDGFTLDEISPMTKISRDVLDLVKQTIGRDHQYPDGLVLFTGTLFAPTKNRNNDGKDFTHNQGDIVRISSDKLGVLENKVTYCHKAKPWGFGIASLMENLSKRKLI